MGGKRRQGRQRALRLDGVTKISGHSLEELTKVIRKREEWRRHILILHGATVVHAISALDCRTRDALAFPCTSGMTQGHPCRMLS